MFQPRVQLFICALALLPLTLACSKGHNAEVVGSEDSSSLVGDGALTVRFISPASGPVPSGMVSVSIEVTPLNHLQTLRLLINDQEVRMFNRMPFEFEFDPTLYADRSLRKSKVVIKAESPISLLFVLSAAAAPLAVPVNPHQHARPALLHPNCMNNNTFDACLFWRTQWLTKARLFLPFFESAKMLQQCKLLE